VFFFEDIFLHFITTNGNSGKRSYAIETISENREKSGKNGKKVNFLKGGGVKAFAA
jgi:hypothetical protein